MLTLLKKYIDPVGLMVAGFITLVILWRMLLPGYILTLDLVFTPSFHIGEHVAGEFFNSLPLVYILKILYLFLPGWLIEKGMLVCLFFLMSYLSFTYIPIHFISENSKKHEKEIKSFVALLYTANTFVYVRMLAGQWTHLFAYALLPLFFHLLFIFFDAFRDIQQKSRRHTFFQTLPLALCLAIIAIFSLQFFLMGVIATLLWTLLSLNLNNVRLVFLNLLLIGCLTFIFTSYWIVPALYQKVPVTAAFTQLHWEAFAAAAHGTIPVLLNLLALGGFWAESHQWASYFAWPQENFLFWIAWSIVFILIVLGCRVQFRQASSQIKSRSIFFIVLAGLSLQFATGAAATLFQPLNLWLFSHIPFWSGFRDSQKWIGFLAFVYCAFAGSGLAWIISRERLQNYSQWVVSIFFIAPICFGIYMWGGLHNQLQPVQYPQSWFSVKEIISKQPIVKTLVLPWHGYFSLQFNHNLIVANPALQFFGQNTVTSQNFSLGGIYDQSVDADYAALDAALQKNDDQNIEVLVASLKKHNVQYIVFFQDISNEDPFSYSFLSSKRFTEVFVSTEVKVYKLD